MFRPFRLLASTAVLAGAAAAPGPAEAQYYGGYGAPGYGYYNAPPPAAPFYGPSPYGGPRLMSSRQVVDRLEDMGYDVIGRPHFSGTLYTVDARGPGDVRLRLVVDAVRGAILNRTVLGGPGFRDFEEDDDEDRPTRRYGDLPAEALPYDPRPRRRPEIDVDSRPRGREAARTPDEPVRPGRALPPPTDPRLAPGART
ncbi:MAG: hypothetical protein JWR86_603, partial [Enterovirga sp.]|nr:hypothetical protein [Enterovirga sp.]